MNPLDDDPLLKPSEVAKLFRVDPKTVTRWAAAGRLPSIRTLGGHRRFRESDIRELLQAEGVTPEEVLPPPQPKKEYWWDKPRKWFDGPYNSGDVVPGVECPRCLSKVLYNGNYFCEDWGYVFKADNTRRGGPCNWALSHPATTREDRALCDALGLDYE